MLYTTNYLAISENAIKLMLQVSDVRYVSKYRDTPGVSGYDTAMLVY